ncbi:DUF4352 domain-containing protein [Rubrobacter marinus]|uniref:DUF4352 domain-containing protein n=1 Tax=Rubrobacter marinus TaxID=2653852 RepID=UPI00140ACF74|nr:DUF4352 domain-containing protein [Rubrobacter marinus]
MGRKILMGCGGLAILGVLGIVAVGCLAVLSSSGSDTADSSIEGNESAQDDGGSGGQPAEERQAVPVGENLTVADVAWQVTNARQANQLTSEFQEPKQGNFVVVDFAFTNNGSEAVTLDSESLALIDGEDRTFETDNETFGYIDPAKDIFLDQVNPGVTQQGEVIFTVAPGASDFTLELGDTDMFSDENGYVDLGF